MCISKKSLLWFRELETSFVVYCPQERKANGCFQKASGGSADKLERRPSVLIFLKKYPKAVMSEQAIVPIVFLKNKGPHPHSSISQATYHNTFFPNSQVPPTNSEDNVIVKRWSLDSVDCSIMDRVEAHWFLCCWNGKGHFGVNESTRYSSSSFLWKVWGISHQGHVSGSEEYFVHLFIYSFINWFRESINICRLPACA